MTYGFNNGSLTAIGGNLLAETIYYTNTPTNPSELATKSYVDSVAQGLNIQASCYAASTGNLTANYNNGSSGVGATLTNAGGQQTFSIDGTTPPVTNRILIKDQSSSFQNGIYTLTNAGSASSNWILTRSTDYETTAQIMPGDLVVVNNGVQNANSSWLQTATVNTIGTDPITFTEFTANPATFLKVANNLSDVNSISTSRTNLGLGTGNSPTFTGLTLSSLSTGIAHVNSSGTFSSSAINLNSSDVTGTLQVANGGTGIATLASGFVPSGAGTSAFSPLAFSITSAATSLVERDSNQNAFANNFVSKASNVVSASGTTTLTAADARWQNLTGSQPQTFQLPNATTLGIGSIYYFNNNTSNSTLTVKDGGGSTLFTIPYGGQGYALLIVNVTTAGSWDFHFSVPSNSSWGTLGLTLPNTSFVSSGQSLLTGTSSGTISILPQAAAGTYNFNLPTTAGTSGYFLTSGGGGSSPMTWTQLSSVGVTSVAGTSSNVLVNGGTGAQMGDVTLSLPSSISVARIFMTGSGSTAGLFLNYNGADSTAGYGSEFFGQIGQNSATSMNGVLFAHDFVIPLACTSASLILLDPTFTIGNTTTTAYNLRLTVGTKAGAGTITTGISLSVPEPAYGTTKIAAEFLGKVNFGSSAQSNMSNAGVLTLGTALAAGSGGTGIASYAVGDILYASGSTALSKLADVATGNALISGGVTTAPSWGKIGLTTHVSGTLAVGNGGTGTGTAFTSGSVVFAGASGVYSQNNANLFWDNSNGVLSIGITPPTYTTNRLFLSASGPTNGILAHLSDSSGTGGAGISFGRVGSSAYAILNDAASQLSFFDNRYPGDPGTLTLRIISGGNLFITNTTSAPGTPTGGGVLYTQGGALKYIGSSGTITTIANA